MTSLHNFFYFVSLYSWSTISSKADVRFLDQRNCVRDLLVFQAFYSALQIVLVASFIYYDLIALARRSFSILRPAKLGRTDRSLIPQTRWQTRACPVLTRRPGGTKIYLWPQFNKNGMCIRWKIIAAKMKLKKKDLKTDMQQ